MTSFATLAWIVPESNQRFRVALTGDRRIARGLNELTLAELHTRISTEREAGGEARAVGISYHSRWALAAAPAVVSLWALVVIGFGANHRWLIALAGIATCAGYVAFQALGRIFAFYGFVPPVVGAWLPNVALTLTALLLARHITSPRLRTTNLES